MKWIFKPSTILLVLFISLFVFETPRSKLANLGDSLLIWMRERNAKNQLSDLPATITPYALMGNFKGFVTADGFQFSVSEYIRHWRNEDTLTWSHAGGGKLAITNSRTGETVTGRFIQVRYEFRNY